MERRESFRERRKRQQARRRLLGKLAAVLIGAVFLFGLCKKTADQFLLTDEKKQDSYIGIEDAGHMVWLLADCRQGQMTQAPAETTDVARDNTQAAAVSAHTAGSRSTPDQVLDLMEKFQAESDDGYLTWTQAKQYFSCLPGSRELFLGGAYTGTELVEEADWYDWFDRARRKYDAAGRIREETVVVLGILKGDENGPGDAQESAQATLMREMGTASGGKKDAQSRKTELRILTQNGVRMAASATFLTESMQFCPVRAIVREDCLYAVRNRLTKPVILKNVWMIETTGQSIHGFWKDCEFSGAAAVEVKTDSAEGQRTEENRESDWKSDRKSTTVVSDTAQLSEAVCDLTFETGKPVIVYQKPDKISGRLLGVSRNGAEIEGHGTIPFSEDLQCYRLYGRLSQMDIGELKIGYGFTDFVVEDGTIEAALAVREEKMETIRVLIKTSGYANSIHQVVELFADCDCRILNVENELTTLEKGQRLVITRDSPLFDQTGRITIEPKILTGHLMLSGVERAQGQANYRGRLELVRREEGIVVINKLPLEEYLYGVVPGEMPASYPLEALKSQAICARTYAYERLQRAGLPEYGAHVDDSTAFQVYQNLAEQGQTTQAVKETSGQVLFYGEEPAQTYYYSTSCGYGTDLSVWRGTRAEAYPYLCAQAIDERNMELTRQLGGQESVAAMAPILQQAQLLEQSDVMEAFLRQRDGDFYEKEEPWYRWSYRVETVDEKALWERVWIRAQADGQCVFVPGEAGEWNAVKERTKLSENTGKIREIRVTKRSSGGAAQELLIESENGQVRIQSEYSIRYVLCDGKTQAVRQDGSAAAVTSLLPSSFFQVSTFKTDGFMIGYTLIGGGYGHGIGMSQNGAKHMAEASVSAEEILTFFYKGCQLKMIS